MVCVDKKRAPSYPMQNIKQFFKCRSKVKQKTHSYNSWLETQSWSLGWPKSHLSCTKFSRSLFVKFPKECHVSEFNFEPRKSSKTFAPRPWVKAHCGLLWWQFQVFYSLKIEPTSRRNRTVLSWLLIVKANRTWVNDNYCLELQHG